MWHCGVGTETHRFKETLHGITVHLCFNYGLLSVSKQVCVYVMITMCVYAGFEVKYSVKRCVISINCSSVPSRSREEDLLSLRRKNC